MDSDARGQERRRRLGGIGVAFLALAFVVASGLYFVGTVQTEEVREDYMVEVEGCDDADGVDADRGDTYGEGADGDETDGQADDAGSSVFPNGEFVSSGECPLSVPGGNSKSYRSNGSGRAWSYVSEEDLDHLASALLVEMRDEGWSLVSSEYLDLYGDAWGCVAQDKGGSRVVLVRISPRILEISESQENELNVSIVELSHVG